jgi:hypothetical protein
MPFWPDHINPRQVGLSTAEADGYAYEPRHPIGEALDHCTGVGTGELREPVPCTSVDSGPSDDPGWRDAGHARASTDSMDS